MSGERRMNNAKPPGCGSPSHRDRARSSRARRDRELAPNPEACTDGSLRCDGDTPEKCEDGQWIQQEPCGGTTPVCSNGVCGVARLSGRIVTVAGAATTGGIRLVDHGFEYLARSCGTVKDEQVCVTGGIRP